MALGNKQRNGPFPYVAMCLTLDLAKMAQVDRNIVAGYCCYRIGLNEWDKCDNGDESWFVQSNMEDLTFSPISY